MHPDVPIMIPVLRMIRVVRHVLFLRLVEPGPHGKIVIRSRGEGNDIILPIVQQALLLLMRIGEGLVVSVTLERMIQVVGMTKDVLLVDPVHSTVRGTRLARWSNDR